MTIHRFIAATFLLVALSGAASCSWIPTYITAPEVEIELVSTTYGRVASASFWSDAQDIVLRGEIVPRPVTKSPLSGHVHAVITLADGASEYCLTTRQRMAVRQVRKPYSFHFRELPPPNSVVQVFYHEHSDDHDCVAGVRRTDLVADAYI